MRHGPEEQPSFESENDVTRPLRMPQETADALDELAEITGAKDFREFSEDRYRTIEWVVFQQGVKDRVVVALPREALTALAEHETDFGEVDELTSYITPGKEEAAKAYFEKHKSRTQKEPKGPQELP